jgi:hypothetical protein
MTDHAFVPTFELHAGRSLRRHGIRGRRVSVGLGEGALFVAGHDGQVLEVPLDSIERMLVGSDRHRSFVIHRLQLRAAGFGTIVLKAKNRTDNIALYADLVHAIAGAMQGHGRLDAIRIGLPRFPAFAAPLVVAGSLVAVTFLAADPASLRATPPEHYLLGGLILLLIVLVATGGALRQGFHRRISGPDDLDRFIEHA